MGKPRHNYPAADGAQQPLDFSDMITVKGTKAVFMLQYDHKGRPFVASILAGRTSRHTPKGEKPVAQLLYRDQKYFEPTLYQAPLDSKFCSACGEWVKRKGFSPDMRNHDGLHAHCKECRNGHARKIYWQTKHTAIYAAA